MRLDITKDFAVLKNIQLHKIAVSEIIFINYFCWWYAKHSSSEITTVEKAYFYREHQKIAACNHLLIMHQSV